MSECYKYVLPGECEAGEHHFVKVIYCGLEWCERCGQYKSEAHKRRINRIMEEVLSMPSCQVLVFTIPEGIRGHFRTKQSLRDLRGYTKRLLQRELGITHGVYRFHFFGDNYWECDECGRIFMQTERPESCDCLAQEGAPFVEFVNDKWHPHLNYLIDYGYILGESLTRIKELYRNWLSGYVGEEVPVVSVYAQYTEGYDEEALKKKLHQVNYITRATATKDKVESHGWFVAEFKGFRNMVRFGTWSGEVPEEVRMWIESFEGGENTPQGVVIETGRCPYCESEDQVGITWLYPVAVGSMSDWLVRMEAREITTGYYEISRERYRVLRYMSEMARDRRERARRERMVMRL